jgi:hypothetical protein
MYNSLMNENKSPYSNIVKNLILGMDLYLRASIVSKNLETIDDCTFYEIYVPLFRR